MEARGWPAFVAELIGTFLLVFFVCTIVTVNSPGGLGATDFAVIGLVHAFVLAMLIYTLGGTSGGHFNPAVTTALAAVRKIRIADALVYIVLQLAGGIAGALLTKVLLLDEGRGAVHYGAVAVSEKFLQGRALPALLAEVVGTFVLMWAIMGCAVNPRGQREWAGLVIGFALGLAVMALAPLTGAGLNPARALGPALAADFFDGGGKFLLVYVAGPVIGALLAALVYRFVVIAPADRVEERPVDTFA